MPNGLTPGDVLRLRFNYSNPPKIKICLCICIETGNFLIINSEPYTAAPADSQVKIFKEELSILNYDSYIDVSKNYNFDEDTIARAIRGGVWHLSTSAKDRIKYSVKDQGYLPKRIKNMVLNNL